MNISMESERDDIRFHFGKAFRTLIRTEQDMIKSIVDKVSITLYSTFERSILR